MIFATSWEKNFPDLILHFVDILTNSLVTNDSNYSTITYIYVYQNINWKIKGFPSFAFSQSDWNSSVAHCSLAVSKLKRWFMVGQTKIHQVRHTDWPIIVS